MKTSRRVVVVACLLGTIGFTHVAEADPLTITSGFYRLSAHRTPVFDFSGDGFRLPGESFDIGIPSGIFPLEDCLVCGIGASIRLGAQIREHELAEITHIPAVFNGVTYNAPLFYAGTLLFEAPAVTVPDTREPFLTFDRPFTLSGTLMAFGSTERTGTPLFTADLRGAGNVTFKIHEGEPRQYNYSDLTYSFQPATPVPEPATLVLLGSGMAGFLLRSRRSSTRR
jgi:hypothetical protein